MKTVSFVAASVLVLASGVAHAQSMHNWSGVYVGGQLGGTFAGIPGLPTCDWIGDGDDYNSDFFMSELFGEDGEPGPPACDRLDDTYEGPAYSDYFDEYSPTFDFDGDYLQLWDAYRDDSKSGWNYGAHFGVNQQFGQAVIGMQASISKVESVSRYSYVEWDYYHDYDPDEVYYYDGSAWIEAQDELDWLATFVARAGFAMGPEGRLLGYGLAGAAIAHVKNGMDMDVYDASEGDLADWCDECVWGDAEGVGDFYQVGYAVGAGAEYAINERVSVGLEYMFVGLSGKKEQSATFYGDDGREFEMTRTAGFDHVHTLNAKVSFKF